MATSTTVVDSAFIYIATISFLLFFAIVFLMIFFAVRYRRSKHPAPADISGNAALEVLWIVIPTLLVLTMFFYGLTGFRFLRNPPPDSLHVKVVSRQWSWLFQYDNGVSNPNLIAPVNRDVRVELTSRDVIHGFFVPAFRIKQDAVPGMTTQAWFKAVDAGSYDILCSQYCGTGHSAMLAKLIVVQQAQFGAWYAGRRVSVPGVPIPTSTPEGEQLLDTLGCISCHSTDGSRIVGPTFKGIYDSTSKVVTNGKERSVTVDEDYMERSILDPGADLVVGYPNIMPSGRGVVTEEQIEEIIRFVKTLK
jgi:cytochrome c oxidase subunit 2